MIENGNSFAANFFKVQEGIKRACMDVDRSPSEVKILAISKKQLPERILSFSEVTGHSYFGENYVQEFLKKKGELPKHFQWDFVGKIQSNKIRSLVGEADLIHSIDRWDILKKIDQEAAKKNHLQKVLLEINIAKEPTKAGFLPDRFLPEFSDYIRQEGLNSISIDGIMVMPPILDDAIQTSAYFQKAKNLFDQVKHDLRLATWRELSMGTSSDYMLAIRHGATIVRLGEILLGPRG